MIADEVTLEGRLIRQSSSEAWGASHSSPAFKAAKSPTRVQLNHDPAFRFLHY